MKSRTYRKIFRLWGYTLQRGLVPQTGLREAEVPKWEANLRDEVSTSSLVAQPVGNDNAGFNTIPEPSGSLSVQQPPDDKVQASSNNLKKKFQRNTMRISSTLNSNESKKSSIIATNEPLSPELVIDLTDDVDDADDKVEIRTQPDLLLRSTNRHKSNSDMVIQSFSRAVTMSKTDASPIASSSTAMKRKRSNKSTESTSLVSGLDAGGPVIGYASSQNTTTRRPRRQRTTARQHLDDEIRWLSDSVPTIEGLIAEAEQEHTAIKEKREREMESVWKRRNDLIVLKEHLQAWGAQDKEWQIKPRQI